MTTRLIIGIDARAASHPRSGGLKTYTDNLIRAMGKIDTTHWYKIYIDRPYTFDFSLPENFEVVVVSGRTKLIGAGWREQYRLPRVAKSDKVALLHSLCNTSPLTQTVNKVLSILDVIALTSEQDTKGERFERWVLKAIRLYNQLIIPKAASAARAIITISEYEKQQIIHTLGLPHQNVYITHLAPNSAFRVLSEEEKQKANLILNNAYGIHPPFLLSVGFEARKNLPGVIKAFSNIKVFAENELTLVLVCANPAVIPNLYKFAEENRVRDRVVILNRVSDEILNMLYGTAAVFVFPSFREGFGLPPLEAMACGTPVVASNTSSFPEILGSAALLVPPTDTEAIRDAIESVLSEGGLRNSLIESGIHQAQKYSWEATASKTLEVYHQATSS